MDQIKTLYAPTSPLELNRDAVLDVAGRRSEKRRGETEKHSVGVACGLPPTLASVLAVEPGLGSRKVGRPPYEYPVTLRMLIRSTTARRKALD